MGDFSMNDCSIFASQRLRALHLLDIKDLNPPALELVDKARKNDESDPSFRKKLSGLRDHISTVVEVFMRLVRQIVPQAMLIMFFAGPPRAWSPEVGWSVYDCEQA